MSLKVFKALASEDLVLVTSHLSERLSAQVELTVSSLLIEELGYAPEAGVRVNSFTPGRTIADRYVEVTEQGAVLVASAVRTIAPGRKDAIP